MADSTPKKFINYKPSEIEKKWQEKWSSSGIYEPNLEKAERPFFNLMMFPYPSAEGLHVGNMYAVTGADIYGRYMRLRGFDVFEPIGLDGFGIHSENYALKVNSHPMEQAQKSEENFYRQLSSIGNSFAWNERLETYDIDYYRWTQWLFVQLFKAGLAYKAEAQVNWCPSCKTVLADEQVIEGKCERCGTEVVKKMLAQWFFRITQYAERLLSGLDSIEWTEKVKTAQRNWIGKSEGARVEFPFPSLKYQFGNQVVDYIEVFTTRPDTLHGATFMVISPEHPLVASLLNSKSEVRNTILDEIKLYVEDSKKKTNQERRESREKTGVFSGVYALNPVNNKQIPIWIADYVLMGYGTGAIMAVPAHDERDFAFAKKYDLPITHIVMPSLVDAGNPPQEGKEQAKRNTVIAVVENPKTKKYLVLDWKQYDWKTFITGGIEEGEDRIDAAKREIAEETGYTDLKLIRELGGPFEAFFYAAHKGVNRQTRTHVLLFELQSEKREEIATDEKVQHEPMWLSEDQLLKVNIRHAEFLVFWERLKTGNDAYTGSGILINSGEWDGIKVPQQISKTVDWLEERGIGKREVTYHLRDWLISRQRYWGPPIPLIFCAACAEKGDSWFTSKAGQAYKEGIGISNIQFPISNDKSEEWNSAGWYPEENLPVELPYIDDYKPLGTGKSPLGNHPEFYETKCPHCGGKATRETDVSDTFLDSSWYFLRYLATDLSSIPFPMDKSETHRFADVKDGEVEKAEKRVRFLPVAQYTGGAEHSVLHLLYTRFFYKVLGDLGYVDKEKLGDEPFPKFFAHGLIIKDGAKMSKSKGNVVVPDTYIKKYGADALRTYLMFLGPFSGGGDFRDSGIEGMYRFLKRVWVMGTGKNISSTPLSSTANSALHKAIKGVGDDISAFRYNTAIAKIMTLYNYFSQESELNNEAFLIFLQLLAPFAPHMTEELWEMHGGKGSIHTSSWPEYDKEAEIDEEVVIAVQVNGKLRHSLSVSKDSIEDQEKIEKMARESERVKNHIEGKDIRKVIFVPGKIVNFVV